MPVPVTLMPVPAFTLVSDPSAGVGSALNDKSPLASVTTIFVVPDVVGAVPPDARLVIRVPPVTWRVLAMLLIGVLIPIRSVSNLPPISGVDVNQLSIFRALDKAIE